MRLRGYILSCYSQCGFELLTDSLGLNGTNGRLLSDRNVCQIRPASAFRVTSPSQHSWNAKRVADKRRLVHGWSSAVFSHQDMAVFAD